MIQIKKIIIERKKLYEEVWNVKMKELATTYGISELELRQHCRKLEVPFPQSGYWVRVRNGSNPKKTPLREYDGDNTIIIYKKDVIRKQVCKSDNRLRNMDEDDKKRILNICGKIKVPYRLNRPHCIIRECKFNRSIADMTREGIANNINIKVSKENENRALRIFDTIFKAFESMGYQIRSVRRETKICIGKEEVRIGLKEKMIRTPHIRTENETYWNTNYDYKYSGELSIFIDEYHAPKKNWRDLNNKKLEDMIGEFIIAILDTAEILKEVTERRRLEAEERRKIEIEKAKIKKRKEFELKKITELKEDAENYRQSKLIDEYIEALEVSIDKINNEDRRIKILQYVEWAKKKSEWINPIKRIKDEILEDKYNDELYDLEFKDSDNYWCSN